MIEILFSASNVASMWAHDNYLSTIFPNITWQFPPAPATTVPSWLQANDKTDPHYGLSNEWDHPDLSHNLSISKDPTAK